MNRTQFGALFGAMLVGVVAGASITAGLLLPKRELLLKLESAQAENDRRLARIESACSRENQVRVAIDPTTVAKLVSAELRGASLGAPDAAAPSASAPRAKPSTVAAEDLAQQGDWDSVVAAQKLIDAAVAARRWTDDDRGRIRVLLRDMPDSEREATMINIAQHVNNGEIKPTDGQPPY